MAWFFRWTDVDGPELFAPSENPRRGCVRGKLHMPSGTPRANLVVHVVEHPAHAFAADVETYFAWFAAVGLQENIRTAVGGRPLVKDFHMPWAWEKVGINGERRKEKP